MSIVEKAAAKLKALQPEPTQAPQYEEIVREDVVPAQPSPTIERLYVEEPAPQVDAVATEEEPYRVHIDYDALLRAWGLPGDSESIGRLANEMRRVKLPLLHNATGRNVDAPEFADRIMITSAVVGEGKTFTSLNLALSLAHEPDFEVLLVDADIPKFDVTRTLGLEGRPGLVDLLLDERQRADQLILASDVPNLSILPAGQRHPLATELFGGQRMARVLDELADSRRQRLIVFDTAPLLATPESRVLAASMGQVVVVVGAGRTRRYELKAALDGLGESQYVGLVLNMSRLPALENPYYGNYGYYGHSQPGVPHYRTAG
ncbi:MAG TPA: AAA family ATPase [Rhodanobacteraceae bacterium]